MTTMTMSRMLVMVMIMLVMVMMVLLQVMVLMMSTSLWPFILACPCVDTGSTEKASMTSMMRNISESVGQFRFFNKRRSGFAVNGGKENFPELQLL